ncbi:UDP-N-acetylmuramoyl-L-alanine--D-glutamate ligase [Aquamicrobium zhengzhouense]|uniref:UDP-N-acetylmuramoylalanine--D-glutamate ligase n=1 Tax=Aquamicrobium zhengzhouense TaxID=2781738 RepID=A0ABS0S9E2_9HYPH|nr:UDP-N-acetylmuramoyl-L-alanine--D-glutamate ligase [Aquamicrobium zhengzhouense]MBI1619112.1 UDP-N-acetylmuramoyl-L-alanine--D-glutamate ligase [Aquamicrobium zhengzhouense]
MTPATTFKGRNVALFGLGGSGLATAKALVAGGAKVQAWDDNPDSVEKARAEGVPVADLSQADWSQFSSFILSPGVPLTHPRPHWSVDLADAAGVEIIGDVEMFSRERAALAPDAPLIAITGTNGKSTTTALIAHILKNAGRDVQMGGNIGRAVMTLDPPASGRHYVIECSSYQIDLAPSLAPTAGILLNLTPDHLDRHGTMQHYAEIKARLVAGSETAIVGVDDSFTVQIADRLMGEGADVIRISKQAPVEPGYFADGTALFEQRKGLKREVASLEDVGSLRGQHNAQNALAAIAACLKVGLTEQEIQCGIESFPGLAHRMEQVGWHGDVLFVNDSKATNAEAAAPALSSFSRIYWIAGGLPKEGGIETLHPYFSRIAKAYLIGEAAPSFAATLGAEVNYEISGTLATAVEHAAADAMNDRSGQAVVLLSPACASFDQFRNFEVRGDAFREAVLALGDVQPAGGKL